MSTLAKALEIAYNAHDGQIDKSNKPYILHPVSVCLYMARDGFIDDVLCAAVLHDVVEDTPVRVKDLEKAGFSDQTVAGVVALTRTENETYRQYRERCLANTIGMAVKLYDSLHNLNRTDGLVDANFIGFLHKRYGGTVTLIEQMIMENPSVFDSIKREGYRSTDEITH